jgi:hypothetical protein
MSTETSKRPTSIGATERSTIETDDAGPLVNGRPVLTSQEVQDWCRSVHVPGLSDSGAIEIARLLNQAAFLRVLWAPEFAETRKANPSTLRMRRIADALAILLEELPWALNDSRAVKPDTDLTQSEALLDLVRKHQPIIDKYRHGPGRPRDLTANLAAKIGRLVSELSDRGRVRTKALDAFVAIAMDWLSQTHPTDAAISRNRRRRAQRVHS